jgi:hypothetical protein
MNFELLRKVAETASGMRNEDHWFIVGDDSFRWQTSDPGLVAGATVIPVKAVNDPLPKVKAASISDHAEGSKIDLMSVTVPPGKGYPGGTYPADAVFWSVSAVEKFLLPYYASVYGDQAPEAVRCVLDILRPPAEVSVDGPAPYAIAHLPSSEYVGLANPAETLPDGRKKYYDNVFLLRDGHAEPLSWYYQHQDSPSAAATADTAATPDTGATPPAGETSVEPQSGSESPRTNGSRSKYSRMAGR